MSQPTQAQQPLVAVVVGGASLVGRACVRAFAENGAVVVSVDADDGANRDACAALAGSAATVTPMRADLSSEADLYAVADVCAGRWGRVDVLVNCHLDAQPGSVEDSTIDSWRRVVSTNLIGPVLSTKAFLPLLKSAGDAAIVHIGSVDGFLGNPLVPSYSAAKGGVPPLTHVMAEEFARYGIRVNCVARAAVEGEMVSEAYLAQLLDATPLRRAAHPDEVAAAVRYLAGPEASYVTGAVLVVDGGRTGITPGTRPLPPQVLS